MQRRLLKHTAMTVKKVRGWWVRGKPLSMCNGATFLTKISKMKALNIYIYNTYMCWDIEQDMEWLIIRPVNLNLTETIVFCTSVSRNRIRSAAKKKSCYHNERRIKSLNMKHFLNIQWIFTLCLLEYHVYIYFRKLVCIYISSP